MVERWRYWTVTAEHLRHPQHATLRPGDPKDVTEWGWGTTYAKCRHDPTHRPPEKGCTCGIYAIGRVDIEYARRGRVAIWNRDVANIWRYAYGADAAILNPPPSTPTEQVRMMRDHTWRRDRASAGVPVSEALYPGGHRQFSLFDPRRAFVVGRVQLHDAVQVDTPPRDDGRTTLRVWRGSSATLESLYIEDEPALAEAGCDPGELADALTRRYGVPCRIGPLPPYGAEDWAERTKLGRLEMSHEDLGLYPDGARPPTQYRHVVVPEGRGKRRELRTFRAAV